eukprot:104294-Alexandrium_andersonii.AAC.1
MFFASLSRASLRCRGEAWPAERGGSWSLVVAPPSSGRAEFCSRCFCVLLRGSFRRLFRARDCDLGASARPWTVLASAASRPVAGSAFFVG